MYSSLLQWGNAGYTTEQETQNTFPISFLNATFIITGTNTDSEKGSANSVLELYTHDLATFIVWGNNISGTVHDKNSMFYIAIGS